MKHAIALAALISACDPAPVPVPDEEGLDCRGVVVDCLGDDDVGNITKSAEGACFECVEINAEGLATAWVRVAPCPF